MTQWVVENLGPDVPMHFSAFHPDWKMLDKPPTPIASLLQARQIALKNGIHYAYVGNVHDKSADSTYCHGCGKLLIAVTGMNCPNGIWMSPAVVAFAVNVVPVFLNPNRVTGAQAKRRYYELSRISNRQVAKIF